MNLLPGALADSFGRRPLILWGVTAFTVSSVGCALSQTLGQLVFFRALPETLNAEDAQPFNARNRLRGSAQLLGHRDVMLLVLACGVPLNGMFLYGLSAPAFRGELLHLKPTPFFGFFGITISGILGGARLAGRIGTRRQIRAGFAILVVVSIVNMAGEALATAQPWWALPLIGLFAFGRSLMVPAVTLLVLDLVPERRRLVSWQIV